MYRCSSIASKCSLNRRSWSLLCSTILSLGRWVAGTKADVLWVVVFPWQKAKACRISRADLSTSLKCCMNSNARRKECSKNNLQANRCLQSFSRRPHHYPQQCLALSFFTSALLAHIRGRLWPPMIYSKQSIMTEVVAPAKSRCRKFVRHNGQLWCRAGLTFLHNQSQGQITFNSMKAME